MEEDPELSVQPINGRDVDIQLAYEIRAGIEDTLNLLLKTEPGFILEARYTFPMTFTENSSHILVKNKIPLNANTNLATTVIMEITTLHLAIISKQVSMVERIIEYLIGDEANGENIRHVFTTKTKAVFSGDDASVYSNDVRSMDGMNCFHLAVKYSTECLYILLQSLRRRGLIKHIPILLEEKDADIGNTPLHAAAMLPHASALRLEYKIEKSVLC